MPFDKFQDLNFCYGILWQKDIVNQFHMFDKIQIRYMFAIARNDCYLQQTWLISNI